MAYSVHDWIVLWVLCAVVAAMVGSRQDRVVAGLFLGLVFGPFGILFATLIRSYRAPCPFCRKYIRFDAFVCRHCRKDIALFSPERADGIFERRSLRDDVKGETVNEADD